jgi:hypothetical protein
LFIFLAFVVPLAIYCMVLSVINCRRHAVFVSGPWDFAGVLFAASGFLLVGGPAILTGIYEQWHVARLLGQTRYLQGIGENWTFWISLWIGYFVVVGGLSAFVLWRRRAYTSIYNIEPPVFTEVLSHVLERLGLEGLPSGGRRLLLRFREPPPDIAAELAVDASGAMRHVSLRWFSHDEALRLEVETELAKALAQVPSGRNPMVVWLLSLWVGLFFSAFMVLLLAILQILRRLP